MLEFGPGRPKGDGIVGERGGRLIERGRCATLDIGAGLPSRRGGPPTAAVRCDGVDGRGPIGGRTPGPGPGVIPGPTGFDRAGSSGPLAPGIDMAVQRDATRHRPSTSRLCEQLDAAGAFDADATVPCSGSASPSQCDSTFCVGA
jgi:hypothetical protein